LIEEEVLELAAKELGVASIADKTRRNIVTGGRAAGRIAAARIRYWRVVMRGIRLFEPCGHLGKGFKSPGIFKTLERRSGLKAAILSDGVIRVGDKIAHQQGSHISHCAGWMNYDFGLHVPASSPTVKAEDLVRFAQQAEALGFYCLTLADHIVVREIFRAVPVIPSMGNIPAPVIISKR